jgi:hypothetical protein
MMGGVSMSGGRVTELEAAVAATRREFGAEHPETLAARVRLASGYSEHERDEDARIELEDVAVIRERVLGPGSRPSARSVRSTSVRVMQMTVRHGYVRVAY